MKKHFGFVFILVALGLIMSSLAWSQEKETIKVVKINIEGNHGVSTQEIKKAISIKKGDQVTEEDLKEQAESILNLGYFQEVVPNYRSEETGAIVTFEVIEKPKIQEIEITGNENYAKGFKIFGVKIPKLGVKKLVSDNRILEVLEETGVEKGKILNSKYLKEGLKKIIEEYEEKGFILIDIGEVKPGSTLSIQIIERKIEEITLKGLDTVPEEVARQYIHIPLNSPIKLAPLQRTVTGLSNSIYFEKMDQSDIEIQPGNKVDQVKMILHLRENKLIEEPTPVKGIKILGATIYSPETLNEELGKLPQETIDNYQVLKALENIYNLYRGDGYSLIQLEKDKLEDNILMVRIYEGVIDSVSFEGNDRTKNYVIEKEITLNPGDVLNQRTLAETYQNLRKLNYFKEVKIDFEPSDQKGHFNITITVVDKKKLGSFNGALSYSHGGLVGKLSLSWKNLYGTGQDIALEYNRGLLGKMLTNWNLKYSTHAFFPELKSTTLTLYRKGPEPQRIGGEASLGYPIGKFTILDLSGKYEHFKEFGEDGEVKESGITGSASIGITYDDRKDPNFPTQGGIKSFNVEKAGGFVVGPEFTKLTLTLIHHFPTWKDQNIAIRAMGGLGFLLPDREKFTLGGVSTIRGFTASDSSDRIFLLNTEYRIKLIEGASLAFFVDTGFDDSIELKNSFGAELRANIPMGLVRISFAWPVVDEKIRGMKIQFGMGPMF